MVWVKICGVKDAESARIVASCRPDAIGLNFYSGSPRVVSVSVAETIVRGLPTGIEAVGVFVNPSPAEVADAVHRCGLQRVQFHGDEPPALLAECHRLLPGIPIIRAWRFRPQQRSELTEYIARCREFNVPLSAVLVDAYHSGAYGGTGQVLPWADIRRELAVPSLPPLVLAGGLTPENVAAAVAAVQPWGVDVASGVESAVGVKAAALVARFVESARRSTSRPHP